MPWSGPKRKLPRIVSIPHRRKVIVTLLPPPRKRRLWRKALRVLLILALLAIGGGMAWHACDQYWADQELAVAVAEASAVEPLRTLQEIEAARAEIPENRNAALRILAAARHFPPEETVKNRPPFPALHPPHPLDPAQMAPRQAERLANAAAFAELRDLAELPEGRYHVAWEKNPGDTRVPHLNRVRQAAHLMEAEAALQAQAGDLAAALRSTRAIINTGRSLGDEPCLLEALVRVACRGRGISTLEWILSQGTAAPGDLAAIQASFELEAGHPILSIAFIGERAAIQTAATGMRDGSIPIDSDGPSSSDQWLWNRCVRYASGPFLTRQQTWMLRHNTWLIEVGRQPPDQWFAAIGQAEVRLGKAPLLAALSVKPRERVLTAACRSQAQLQCAVVALAVERYRIAHDRWPDALAELCPTFLSAVPLDPYCGKPLRLVRTADGVIVYSVGPDQTDDGGKLDRSNKGTPGTDFGFQLWDATRRGAAPER